MLTTLIDLRKMLEEKYKGPQAAYIIGCMLITIVNYARDGYDAEYIYNQIKLDIDMLSKIEYKLIIKN